MKLTVMQFDSASECKQMATKFLVFVIDIFDSQGYELCERIVWPSGKSLRIDRAYLNNWLKFESNGYK